MLVRLLRPESSMEYDGWDFENAMFIKGTHIDTYDQFVKFLDFFKEHDKDITIGEDCYSVIDYSFAFPEDENCIPALNIYVCDAY